MNNTNRLTLQSLAGITIITLAALLQSACAPPSSSGEPPDEIDLIFDPSIEWLDLESKDRLINEVIAGLKANPQLTKIRLIEIGKEKKASEAFSTDFDLGATAK